MAPPGARYPSRALSEGRHRASTRRFPPALLAIPVVLVLGVGAWLLFFRGGSAGGILDGIIGDDDGPDMTVPEFHFKVKKTTLVPTEGEREQKPTSGAKSAARDAGELLSSLYSEAFLDPANWREGSYDDVWSMFEDGASGAARKDVDVLTVGPTAGTGFEDIEPRGGSFFAKVLTDQKGEPVAVATIVKFSATATGEDGTTTLLASQGQFLLERAGGGWKVVSYDVGRADRTREPKPGPSGSPSAEASP